jgi:L-alanine-DL-glutamate epimerase-like enolase superfamily enzyme
MRITKVSAVTVQGNFDWVLVRVATDEDVSGLGECFAPHNSDQIKQYVLSLAPQIIGESPLNVARLTLKMGLGGISGHKVNALSGIEIALWDLVGKALGVPVYTLLGGNLRSSVKIYVDCHAGEAVTSLRSYGGESVAYTPEAYAANALKMEKQGFQLLKFDMYPGFPGPGNRKIESPISKTDLEYCIEIVRCVRSALSNETGLALDLGGSTERYWTTGDAIRLANAFEQFDLDWIEDPVPGTNIEALAEVTRGTRIPVLCSYTQLRNMRHLAREVIVRQAARLFSIDFGNIGGLLEGRKITDLAEQYFMPIATHNIASPVGTVAAAQASATMPNFMVLEHHAVEVPWWDRLVKNGPVIENGYYMLNERPGLGIELNEEEVRKHLKEGERYEF